MYFFFFFKTNDGGIRLAVYLAEILEIHSIKLTILAFTAMTTHIEGLTVAHQDTLVQACIQGSTTSLF